MMASQILRYTSSCE